MCPPLTERKLRAEAARPPVGIVRMMTATSHVVGGLPAALRKAIGLKGFEILVKHLGGELTVDLDQGDPRVLELTLVQCNNGEGNFHETDSELKTAKVLQAAKAAVQVSDSGRDVYGGNVNVGDCTRSITAKGVHHCLLDGDYTPTQREAMRQTALVMYEKVSESFPATKVLLAASSVTLRRPSTHSVMASPW